MPDYLTIDPDQSSTGALHGHLLSAIAPRPIAFVSTLGPTGVPNLAPFSYFNVFSTRPPVVIIGPSRSGRTGLNKHTFNNAKASGEVVINLVSYAIVEQASLASVEYPEGVNEFAKAGLTPLPSSRVKPFRVAESPVQLECKVNQIIELSEEPGGGNLVICEILAMHIDRTVLNTEGRIDIHKIDLVARMGGNWYCRANGEALFEIDKPTSKLAVGIDALPESIRLSKVLTGSDLAKLASAESQPSEGEVAEYAESLGKQLKNGDALHAELQALILEGAIHEAWLLMLASKG